MSFNSLKFILFLAAFAIVYFLVPGKLQKYFLLVGNYVFYMYVYPVFGLLIMAGTAISYFCARAAEDGLWGRRKLWIAVGAIYTIGVLLGFKYLDFLCGSILSLIGLEYAGHLNVILPVGISFFTFSVAGYLFDVGKGKIHAEKSFLDYAVFVSFFPTIMAGPIGYARNFLPQLKSPKSFSLERVKRGALRFTWGAAKKMILADTLAIIVNTVYADAASFSNGMILLAAVSYSLQIYFDFSAYSDMAIGTADILGFEVMENFKQPYLTRSVKDFWKKWHISLTSWLREYIYFPLGGSRNGKWRTYLNVLIVFTVSGLWHGAAVTFVVWGLLNGLYQVIGEMTLPARKKLRESLHIPENSRLLAAWQTILSFLLVTVAWVFFKAGTITQAVYLVGRILGIFIQGFGGFNMNILGLAARQGTALLICLVPFVVADFLRLNGKRFPAVEKTDFLYSGLMLTLIVAILVLGVYGRGFNPQDFVYFKF